MTPNHKTPEIHTNKSVFCTFGMGHVQFVLGLYLHPREYILLVYIDIIGKYYDVIEVCGKNKFLLRRG